jgi:hypothetical protein
MGRTTATEKKTVRQVPVFQKVFSGYPILFYSETLIAGCRTGITRMFERNKADKYI